MALTLEPRPDHDHPRPVPESYWVVPGRLLAGEYPGSYSRADALDRLRRFIAAELTCFVDLTEPEELPPYNVLLPLQGVRGRRIQYFREPIPDHGVPNRRESMARVVELIDDALEDSHNVYLHCRAGIGRSATVAACWLVHHGRSPDQALAELQLLWRQSRRAQDWPSIPETEQQADFVRHWRSRRAPPRLLTVPGPARAPQATAAAAGSTALGYAERLRGALLGLAAGDAAGAAASGRGAGFDGEWTQPTALTLCLADSLLETGSFDAHDQIGRYLRWQREGRLSATGRARGLTTDIEKALARYQWRRLPMAGSHDPNDRSTACLPRTLAAVAFAPRRSAAMLGMVEDCARTTHQAPVVLDACRAYGALLFGALRGDPPATVLAAGYAPEAATWRARPLKDEVAAMLNSDPLAEPTAGTRGADALGAVARARRCVSQGGGVAEAVRLAIAEGVEPALDGALAGALAGALYGPASVPAEWLARLAQRDWLERYAARLAERGQTA
jgi:ADP-ribosylglycohydrolase